MVPVVVCLHKLISPQAVQGTRHEYVKFSHRNENIFSQSFNKHFVGI